MRTDHWALRALLPVLVLATAGTASAGPVVQTQAGAIEGTNERAGVESFLGVPFAAPPVGERRWRAPLPPTPWRGVRSATAFSRDCIQEPQSVPPGPGFNNPTSEDCLYLNIWRPAQAAATPLPVMVWIYGGAFIMGAGSFPSYDGAMFARGGVILVTFNYRLGRFGTFAHPALTREQAGGSVGNYGIMDQVAALKWVRANIAAFGGDPVNVTIFGESAGARSVNILMASPAAHGLFAKAVSQSGGGGSTLHSVATAEAAGKAWAEKHGAESLAALRALPPEAVWDGPVRGGPVLVEDGQLIAMATDEAFRTGAVADVPYINGFNSQEESLLRWLPDAAERWFGGLGAAGQGLLALYAEAGTDRREALDRLWGEANYGVSSRARAHAVAARGGGAWLYRYAYVPDAAGGAASGAGHEAEIEMVFANPDPRWTVPWSAADAGMARTVQGYWLNFARTGDPNGAGLPPWPAYGADDDVLMGFDARGAAAVRGFGKARFDAIEAIKP